MPAPRRHPMNGVPPRRPGALRLALTLLLVVGGAGCGGYRLGPVSPGQTAGKVIQVGRFENQTVEPRLTDAVQRALRQDLQIDGSYRLGTARDADVVVSGTILEYLRAGLSYQPTDVVSYNDYEIRLVCRIVATERATGRVLVDRSVSGRTSVRATNDLVSAERQALPLLADDMARKVTVLLTEGAW